MNAEDWTPEEEQAWNEKMSANRTNQDAAMQLLRDGIERARNKQVGGSHYKDMGVEPWDVVDTWPVEQRIGAYRHGALKYVMRMGTKDISVQEIQKAIHYLEKLVEVLKEAK